MLTVEKIEARLGRYDREPITAETQLELAARWPVDVRYLLARLREAEARTGFPPEGLSLLESVFPLQEVEMILPVPEERK